MSIPTVLIIDDSKYDRLLYKEYLGSENFNFKEINDGNKLLDCLKDELPDLILLDWQMKHTDGLTTLKILNRSAQFRTIPVIVLTGYEKSEALELAFNYGCTDFIQKPVEKIELNARVENILKLQSTQQELIKQKEELKELYSIVREQKDNLERSLGIKNEFLDTQERKLKLEKEETEKELIALSIQMHKILNHVKQARNELKGLLKYYSGKTTTDHPVEPEAGEISSELKSVRKILDRVDEESINNLNYKRLIEFTDEQLIRKLLKINPRLTSLDLRHCIYLKMNLSNHEIADIMNVELKSLQMSRYRIKKKLNIDSERSLRELIISL